MVYPEVIHGMFVDLRSITLDDAEFSYVIRADKHNRETVGQLAPSLEAQKDFIRKQMQEPNDYYFVVLNKNGKRIGLIGAYNLQGDIIEVGREVNIGEPTETMETKFLIRDFCRQVLGLNKICGIAYVNNKKRISDAKKMGGVEVKRVNRGGREGLYFEFDLTKESDSIKRIKKLLTEINDKKQRSLYE